MNIFNTLYVKILAITIVGILFTSCSPGLILVDGKRGTASVEIYGEGNKSNRISKPAIPPGHMPPPGSCRIWYPHKPPGQQPPPGDCYILSQQIPPRAWLIQG